MVLGAQKLNTAFLLMAMEGVFFDNDHDALSQLTVDIICCGHSLNGPVARLLSTAMCE